MKINNFTLDTQLKLFGIKGGFLLIFVISELMLIITLIFTASFIKILLLILIIAIYLGLYQLSNNFGSTDELKRRYAKSKQPKIIIITKKL